MIFAKKKLRLLSLLSVLFLSQCCCIVLPLQGQIKQELPTVGEMIQQIEGLLPERWGDAAWAINIDHIVVR